MGSRFSRDEGRKNELHGQNFRWKKRNRTERCSDRGSLVLFRSIQHAAADRENVQTGIDRAELRGGSCQREISGDPLRFAETLFISGEKGVRTIFIREKLGEMQSGNRLLFQCRRLFLRTRTPSRPECAGRSYRFFMGRDHDPALALSGRIPDRRHPAGFQRDGRILRRRRGRTEEL